MELSNIPLFKRSTENDYDLGFDMYVPQNNGV